MSAHPRFTPTELAVLEAFVPRLQESADGLGWICEDEGRIALGRGSTPGHAQESWLISFGARLIGAGEQRRRAEARDLHPNSPEEGA